MYVLGFFSKHATQRGLLIGVGAGFFAVWYAATQTDIAWPWYCLIGGASTIGIGWLTSRMLDGRQAEWSVYSVPGQRARAQADGHARETWSAVPGVIDPQTWWLIAYLVATLVGLVLLERMV
jgi:SSS family solute:Na+ symporter